MKLGLVTKQLLHSCSRGFVAFVVYDLFYVWTEMGGLTLRGAALAAVRGSELDWGGGVVQILKSSGLNVHRETFLVFMCVLLDRSETQACERSSTHVLTQDLGTVCGALAVQCRVTGEFYLR